MWVERLEARPELVLPVIENLREWDKREAYALRFHDDPTQLALEATKLGPVAWVAGIDDRPIALFGCLMMWPGVWSLWLIATDDFGRIGISMTRLIIHSILPMLREAGAHRMEARSMEGHEDAQRWLEVIGARREATLKGYGRGGEDFHVYTWEPS